MKKMAKLLALAICLTLFLVPTISWAATPEEESSSPSDSISLIYEVDEQPPQSVKTPLKVQTTPKTNDKPLAIGCVLIAVGSATLATITWKKAHSNEK